MCSIMGYFEKIAKERFLDGFNKTIDRGPDMSRVIEVKEGFLGFHRLAIMDLSETGMQPFCLGEKYSLCNGEIYGFRELKKHLAFDYKSKSDCEIILPMYGKYGELMFSMLDAEFALIIYDGGKVIAARDPMGIRPLFYGKNKGKIVAFASEAKNISHLCEEVFPFPPGHYFKDGKFVCYNNLAHVSLFHFESNDSIYKGIRERLVKAVEKRLDADAPVGFLLSGGLDSSLICSIAQKLTSHPIKTYAVGMDKDAIDLKYAKEVADFIGSDHKEIIITKKDVLESIEKIICKLETFDITTIRASIGMYLLCKGIKKIDDIRVLLTGEVSDELFGYKYTDFAPSSKDFQLEAQKRVEELFMYDVLRADRCIAASSMESRVPFADIDFVKYVMAIDPDKKMNTYHKGKYLLRKAFEGEYLPESILYREKAAFSDAVGHSMVDDIKEYAEEKYTDEEFAQKIAKYDYARPFTKESLLYREIFEKYYPGKANLIKDFWMPNANWDGCKVNDPSARVLSNYGDSGK